MNKITALPRAAESVIQTKKQSSQVFLNTERFTTATMSLYHNFMVLKQHLQMPQIHKTSNNSISLPASKESIHNSNDVTVPQLYGIKAASANATDTQNVKQFY